MTLTPWMKRIASVVVLGAIFGTLGHFVSPKLARSESTLNGQQAAQLNASLQAAQAKLNKLTKELEAARAEVEQAAADAQTADQAVQAEKAKLTAAEQNVASLTTQLQEANNAGQPLRDQLAQAQAALAKATDLAKSAQDKAGKLSGQLAAATKARDGLNTTRRQLETTKATLEQSLATRSKQADQYKQLLAALCVGKDGQAPAAPKTPGEMPITVRELTAAWGNPTVSVTGKGTTQMNWKNEHAATAAGGIVTTIDGQPAARAALGDTAPAAAEPVGQWRHGASTGLSYLDLVKLFGRPEKIVGTGADFHAAWAIGAWGRSAWAHVVNGDLTEFDGRGVDGPAVCELVRQRTAAYADALEANSVTAWEETWQNAYATAQQAIEKALQAEAGQLARDGYKLTSWSIGEFDSSATWIAPVKLTDQTIMVRTVVDCTWRTNDGGPARGLADATPASHVQRRYAIVTVPTQGTASADCLLFTPRD